MRVALAIALVAVIALPSHVAVAQAEIDAELLTLMDSFPKFQWQASSRITVDINADGLPDTAFYGETDITGAVGIVLGGKGLMSKRASYFDFMLSGASHQRGICGAFKKLEPENQDDSNPFEALGDRPEGWKGCPKCFEIQVVDDGGCDPLFIYWNHVRKSLDYWRA